MSAVAAGIVLGTLAYIIIRFPELVWGICGVSFTVLAGACAMGWEMDGAWIGVVVFGAGGMAAFIALGMCVQDRRRVTNAPSP